MFAELEANLESKVLSQQKAFETAAAEIKVVQEQDVDGSDGSNGHVEPDVKFILQTFPVVKPDDLVQDYINKSTNNPTVSDNNIEENMCKFLCKKVLAISRQTIFSKKAESYQSWKTSFKNVMFEMDTSASEEMDLAVKWLGPSSR
ncbi:hypothetical protein DPMN_022581 [Dreissena polymorpha]|uniref:Uncharacterized protein n=1 Tax=Dreissena polymorpha TaxID=45954 RepID=A0A9D4SCI3_DREPO|nr:hypothetical protein DPMN_022581 [Dreissena polymorpha]